MIKRANEFIWTRRGDFSSSRMWDDLSRKFRLPFRVGRGREGAVQKKKRVELESGVAALRCSHKYEILIEKYNAINKLG